MKIVFINLSLRPGSKRKHLPIGLAYVMTGAKRAGFEFDLIDMDIVDMSFDDLKGILEKESYDVYAFGCIVTGFKYVRKAAGIIKFVNPNSLIIAGNSVATSIPRILLEHTDVDILVMGEGDIAIVDLLKNIEERGDYLNVKGIAFKKDGKVVHSKKRRLEPVIDTFGYPDFELFNLLEYRKYGHINANVFSSEEVLSFPLSTARGCPYNCTFCYHVFKGEKYRRYSDDTIIDGIKRLYNEYGVNHIRFWDELSFPSIKDVKSLVAKLGKLEFSITWDAPCRAGLFKQEHLNLIKDMRDVGCDNMAFSLENADPAILAAMDKKITVRSFIEQVEVLQKGGVVPLTSVIFGYPQESVRSIKMTLDVCERCNIFPSVGFLLPLPSTPIYEWAKSNGYIDDEVAYLERIGDRQDFHINLTRMSDEELIERVTMNLENLAEKQGFKFESVFKTTTYQSPLKPN